MLGVTVGAVYLFPAEGHHAQKRQTGRKIAVARDLYYIRQAMIITFDRVEIPLAVAEKNQRLCFGMRFDRVEYARGHTVGIGKNKYSHYFAPFSGHRPV